MIKPEAIRKEIVVTADCALHESTYALDVGSQIVFIYGDRGYTMLLDLDAYGKVVQMQAALNACAAGG